MTLPLFPETYTISRLGQEIQSFLGEAFRSVWVAGEVQRLRETGRGHLYLELVEKGERDEIAARLEAVIFRSDWQLVRRALQRTGQQLVEGHTIRVRGGIDFWPPNGAVRLVVREVDTVFTEGLLAARRRQTLMALQSSGLLERNRALALAPLPLTVALVTSRESAAYHDFLATLRESGYGFRVVLVHASVQGREAEREVASALRALAGARIDCVALVRGGGSRADLAAFDSRAIAEAVARAPFPVLTGLGHEIDEAVADLAAHLALKTPTKVAEFLVARVADAERRTREAARILRREGLEPLRRARQALGAAERGLALARMRLGATRAHLEELGRALALVARGRLRHAAAAESGLRAGLQRHAPRQLERGRRLPAALGRRVVDLSRGRVRETVARLEGLGRLIEGLRPERTMERGYSITRDLRGALVRDPLQVAPGERISTQVSRGTLRSIVEES